MSLEVKNRIKYWLLPAGIIDICKEIKSINLKGRCLCRPNARFKGMHQGKRCFILCNGPSVKKQNLLPLKDEIVFSVSSGYHHKDYLTIRPKYHCIPQVDYNKYRLPSDIVSWFIEMHSRIGEAELFINVAQEPLIRKNNLFPGRKINYIYSRFLRNETDKGISDISKMVPWVTTAPILSLMIAMYMGFSRIYLLGVDSDWWKTGEYKYFFEPTVLKGKDECAYPDGKLRDPLYEQFFGWGKLLKQYWIMHNIARANNISIFNATDGGALEEFERVKFEGLF